MISLPIGSLAGYRLARTRGRGSSVALAGLLVMRSLPPMLLVIPCYTMARWLHPVDTYSALVLPRSG